MYLSVAVITLFCFLLLQPLPSSAVWRSYCRVVRFFFSFSKCVFFLCGMQFLRNLRLFVLMSIHYSFFQFRGVLVFVPMWSLFLAKYFFLRSSFCFAKAKFQTNSSPGKTFLSVLVNSWDGRLCISFSILFRPISQTSLSRHKISLQLWFILFPLNCRIVFLKFLMYGCGRDFNVCSFVSI